MYTRVKVCSFYMYRTLYKRGKLNSNTFLPTLSWGPFHMQTHLTQCKTKRVLTSKQLKVFSSWHLIDEESNTVQKGETSFNSTVTTRHSGCFSTLNSGRRIHYISNIQYENTFVQITGEYTEMKLWISSLHFAGYDLICPWGSLLYLWGKKCGLTFQNFIRFY